MKARPRGYTLIEMMMTVALVGIMASIAINYFNTQIMLAKRTEAVLGLSMLWRSQLGHYYRAGKFSGTFDQLDFRLTQGQQTSTTTYVGNRYTFELSQPWGDLSFYCVATAQLDTDPWPDVVEIYDIRR